MKYIYTDSDGVTHFNEYFEYIESIRGKLPEHVFEFASNYDYYNLTSRSSLHDAWLVSMEVRESAQGERKEIRKAEVSLSLLGPYHDRRITLEYREVKSHRFSSDASDAGHGDLFVHEIRLSKAGFIIHELQFERGSIVIECKNFEHKQDIYA